MHCSVLKYMLTGIMSISAFNSIRTATGLSTVYAPTLCMAVTALFQHGQSCITNCPTLSFDQLVCSVLVTLHTAGVDRSA